MAVIRIKFVEKVCRKRTLNLKNQKNFLELTKLKHGAVEIGGLGLGEGGLQPPRFLLKFTFY